jgi:hypothetical protein
MYIHIQRTFTYDKHIITFSDSRFHSSQGNAVEVLFFTNRVSNKSLKTTYLQQSLQICTARGILQKVHLKKRIHNFGTHCTGSDQVTYQDICPIETHS